MVRLAGTIRSQKKFCRSPASFSLRGGKPEYSVCVGYVTKLVEYLNIRTLSLCYMFHEYFN